MGGQENIFTSFAVKLLAERKTTFIKFQWASSLERKKNKNYGVEYIMYTFFSYVSRIDTSNRD